MTVLTNECGTEGNVYRTPHSITRGQSMCPRQLSLPIQHCSCPRLRRPPTALTPEGCCQIVVSVVWDSPSL